MFVHDHLSSIDQDLDTHKHLNILRIDKYFDSCLTVQWYPTKRREILNYETIS
jgi:hypothetical protein